MEKIMGSSSECSIIQENNLFNLTIGLLFKIIHYLPYQDIYHFIQTCTHALAVYSKPRFNSVFRQLRLSSRLSKHSENLILSDNEEIIKIEKMYELAEKLLHYELTKQLEKQAKNLSSNPSPFDPPIPYLSPAQVIFQPFKSSEDILSRINQSHVQTELKIPLEWEKAFINIMNTSEIQYLHVLKEFQLEETKDTLSCFKQLKDEINTAEWSKIYYYLIQSCILLNYDLFVNLLPNIDWNLITSIEKTNSNNDKILTFEARSFLYHTLMLAIISTGQPLYSNLLIWHSSCDEYRKLFIRQTLMIKANSAIINVFYR